MTSRLHGEPRRCPAVTQGETASGRPALVECGATVPAKRLLCREHWFAVPAGLRTDVLRTWGRWGRTLDDEDWHTYLDARRAALDAIAPRQETTDA